MQGEGQENECDYTLYKGDFLSEPLFEDFTYDLGGISENRTSQLNILRTCPGDKDSFYSSEWKDSNEELSSQEESTKQYRMLDKSKESCGMEEDPSDKAAWEFMTEEALPAKDSLADTRNMPIPVVMGESLLDEIVKVCSKEGQIFLTHPTSSLFKRNACFTDKDVRSDVSDMADQNGNMTDTEETSKSADTWLSISPDTLDENLSYICTLMQSNRQLKEHLKRNLAYCINQKVVSTPFPPEIIETVSKGEHKAEEKLISLQAEVAKDCKQGDKGEKGGSLSHRTKSCCLNDASLKLCERNPSEFSSKQLLLQGGNMDFCGVINSLGQDQQKPLTHVLDLQCCSVALEKKIKEIENLLPQEGDTELEYSQRKQQTQIMDLYYDAISLRTKIKEMEGDIFKQHDFDTISSLKRSVADLTEAKNKTTEEKDKIESYLKSTEEALASTKGHLQDCEAERSTLMLQLKKFKADIGILQEKLQEEVKQKTKYISYSMELDSILHRKEQEIQELSNVKHKLEQKVSSTVSTLQKMKEEKDSLKKRVAPLEASQQKQKDERQAEWKELVCKYNKLITQIKILQGQSEKEKAEMEKMHQEIHTLTMETGELQQQIAKDKNENRFLQAESAGWKEQYDQIRESQTLREKMLSQFIKVLRYRLRLQQKELRKKEEIIAMKMHIFGRLHLDMKSVHSDLSSRSVYTEENNLNSPYIQKASNLLLKIRSLLALTEGLLTCQVMQNSPSSTSSTQ